MPESSHLTPLDAKEQRLYSSTPSGVVAMTGTEHLMATVPVSCLNNGGTEHGPFRLNIPHLPRNMVEALPEVGVKAPSGRGVRQTFPADPHNMFGPARSDRHPPHQQSQLITGW